MINLCRSDLPAAGAETLKVLGRKPLRVVTGGACAKRPFVRPVLELGVTLIGLLRKDAALYDLPPGG